MTEVLIQEDNILASLQFRVRAYQRRLENYSADAELRVVDLLENRVLADGITEFPLKLASNSTILLRLEKPEKQQN